MRVGLLARMMKAKRLIAMMAPYHSSPTLPTRLVNGEVADGHFPSKANQCALPLSRSRSLSLLFWSAADVEDALCDFSCPVFEELEPEAVVERADAEEPERGYGGEIVPERVRREVVAEEEADADAGFAEVDEELD